MPGPLGPIALAALRTISNAKIVRTIGGITGQGSKSVNPVYKNMTDKIQANSVKVTKTQAQINAEGLKKIKEALNLPKKGTPEANKISSQIKKDSVSSSEKAGKASTKISKKTYKN